MTWRVLSSLCAALLLWTGACRESGSNDHDAASDAGRDGDTDAIAPADADDRSSDADVGDSGTDSDADGEAVDGGDTDTDADADEERPPDPATCPIGPSDGCCPLLRHGGSDPDCPSLACEALLRGEPIELDDLEGGWRSDDWKGGTGLAWTGRELALARTDWDEDGTTRSIVFELRDGSGAPTFGPVRFPEDTSSGLASRAGEAALAYVPETGAFVYANSTAQSFDAVGIGLDGAHLYSTGTLLSYCNWNSGAWVDIFPVDGRALFVGSSYTCAGSTNAPRVTEILATGERGLSRDLGEGDRPRNCWEPTAACDLGCETPRFLYYCSYESSLRLRPFDPVTLEPGMSDEVASLFYTSPYVTSIASDGERFLVMYAPGSLSTGESSFIFRIYQPGVGWIGDGYQTSSTMFAEVARALWTGDGYLVAATTWIAELGETSTPLSDQRRFTVHIWHFAPDGTLRESFDNEDLPGLHPYLAWAGGRVALSWVRPIDRDRWDSNEPRRFIRFFECE